MRTETLAIVFTDIKGYTAATSAQSHKENARMLRRVEKVITPVVKAFNGRVIKSIGDAYMIVFRSPTTAVRCATAVQDRLHQHNAGASSDQAIHIRIAMNLGEVRVHRGDVFGEPVNIAARIEGVTPADEIYLSDSVYLTMNRSELPIESVGAFELKGIPEPVAVHRVKRATDVPDTEDATKVLPFGGAWLHQWHRMRWLRLAYLALWLLVVSGIVGAAYLRYRPSSDYGELVAAAKTAAELGDAHGILAAAGQIPSTAVQERSAIRRHRHKAVGILLEEQDYDTVRAELEDLLREDQRDADAIVLRGLLHLAQGNLPGAIRDMGEALKIDENLARRPEVVKAVVEGYGLNTTRRAADSLVQEALKERAIPALAEVLRENRVADRVARHVIAARLEKLGAGHEVDWVLLSVADLKSTSCKVRKAAIGKLLVENDERAVGPLMKLAEGKGCGTSYANKTAMTILGK